MAVTKKYSKNGTFGLNFSSKCSWLLLEIPQCPLIYLMPQLYLGQVSLAVKGCNQ